MYVKDIGCQGMDCINLTQDKGQVVHCSEQGNKTLGFIKWEVLSD
jgi:hypothetical protein